MPAHREFSEEPPLPTIRAPVRTMLYFFIPAVLVLIAGWAVYSYLRSGPNARTVSGTVHQLQLENGLKILVYEDPAVPIVNLQLWYRVGSRNEVEGKRGLAHLMEHMMFKGSQNVGPEEHARQIDQVGGVANAFTREDVTVYWESVPSDQLELVMRLEAERMHRLVITEEHLRAEREVVKEEHRLSLQNQPLGRVFALFRGIAFKGTPYAWTAAGEIEDLDAITGDELKNFYQTYYAPNNAVLIVVGDVKLEQVTTLAKQYFGPIPQNPQVPPYRAITLPAQSARQEEELSMPVQLPMILGGYRLPPAGSEDLPALEVAGMILSSGESSRLYKKLVREKELAIQALGVPLIYKDLGIFILLAFFTADQDPHAVRDELIAQIARLQTEAVSETELQKAKNQLTAQEIFEQDALAGVAQALGQAEVIWGNYQEFSRGAARYERVTAEEILSVAQKYLTDQNLTLVVLKPQGGTP
jgi:zinc protease